MLAMLLTAAMLSAQPAAAPPKPPLPPAVRTSPAANTPVMNNIREVFTSDSYPADALRAGIEGTSRVAVSVDAAGRVTACTIRSTSGSASLDAAACRLIRERGKFSPARDARKRAIAGEVVLPVAWRIQNLQAGVELTDFSVKLIYALSAGVPSGACRGELSPVGDVARLCEESRATALKIANDIPQKDRAAVGELVMIIDSRQTASAEPPPLMGIPGLVILDDRHFTLTVDAAGKVIQCTGGGSTLAGAGGPAPFCARFAEQKYAPNPAGGPRTIIFRSQIYARR